MNKPEYIILHHSLTKDQKTVDWQAIRRYHLGLGWRDVGYHYGIELINNSPEILLGRYEYESGAHCKQSGMNRKSLGVMICGNFDLAPPREDIWIKTLELVSFLQWKYNITTNWVRGHREYADYKTCPGRLFDIEKFKDEL